jgi:hypothetical protein
LEQYLRHWVAANESLSFKVSPPPSTD